MINDSIDNLIIDLNKPALRGTIYVRQGDTRARTIHIRLTENGKVKDLSNASLCELLIKKPDGNQCDQTMVRDGNELQYTFRTQDINVAGECFCQVMVNFKDGGSLVSPDFTVMVYEKVIDQALEKSTNDYSALATIKIDVEKTKNDMDQTISKTLGTMTDIQAKADSSANSAALSASASAIASSEAQGHALSAKSYEETAGGYVDTVAGLATVVNDDKEIVAGYLDEVTGIAATKMDKVDPTGTGTLTIPSIKTELIDAEEKVILSKKTSFAMYDSALGRDAEYNLGQTWDDLKKVIRGIQESGIAVDAKVKKLEEDKLDKNNPVVSGGLAADTVTVNTLTSNRRNLTVSRELHVGDENEYTLISNKIIGADTIFGTVEVIGNSLYTNIDGARVNVGETLKAHSADIEELKNRPSGSASLTLTSASPLSNSTKSAILGIDALGKSEQPNTDNMWDAHYGYHNTSSGWASGQANTVGCADHLLSCSEGQTYAIGIPSGANVYVGYYNSSKAFIKRESATATITIPSGCEYFFVSAWASSITESNYKTINVTLNAIPTPTSPIPIIDASGVIEAANINLMHRKGEEWSQGTYGDPQNVKRIIRRLPITETSGQFTIWCEKRFILQSFKKGTIEYIGNITNWVNAGTFITFTKNDYDVVIVCSQDNGTSPIYPDDNPKIMLVSGTERLNYIEPQSNEINLSSIGITLRSVGEVKDELIVNADGTGKLIQRVEIAELDTFNWYDGSGSAYWYTRGIADKIRLSTSTSEMPNMLCTTLSANTRNETTGKGTNFITVYANGNVVATSTNIPIGILYYELATPIITDLTAEQVASIRALQTYDGTTIIDSEMEIASVSYSGDIKGYIDSAVKPNEIGEIAYSEYAESTTFTITFNHPINVGDRFTAEADHFYSTSAIQSTTYGIVIDNGGKAFSAKIAGGLALPTVTWDGNSLTFVFGTSTIKGYVSATKTGKVNAAPAMAMALSEVADE